MTCMKTTLCFVTSDRDTTHRTVMGFQLVSSISLPFPRNVPSQEVRDFCSSGPSLSSALSLAPTSAPSKPWSTFPQPLNKPSRMATLHVRAVYVGSQSPRAKILQPCLRAHAPGTLTHLTSFDFLVPLTFSISFILLPQFTNLHVR